MTRSPTGWAWGLVLVLLLAPAAGAQSLSEAAAREKSRREKQGKTTPARSYTDEDLKDPTKPADKEKGKDSSTASVPQPVSNTSGGASSSGSPSVAGADEAAWRRRARDQREAVHNAEKAIQEIQERLNALMTDRDVTSTQDPSRLQTIEARKNEARAALDVAQLGLAEAQKALQDLEEEARRSNVPPGWLREP